MGAPLPRRTFAAGLGASAVVCAAERMGWAQAKPGAARPEDPIPTLPLSIAVAEDAGKAVRGDAWIDAQIAEAQRLFDPLGVHFRKTSQRILEARFAHLETRKDRDALDAVRQKGVVNVFVVATLRDVDDPRLYRMGVHWRPVKAPGHRFVIVSAEALPTTLAHELGHYNGLDHSPVVDNLMSYNRTGERVFLSPSQAKAIRAFARIAFASGELVPPPDPPPAPGSTPASP